jgi:hypothetical protein
MRSRFALLVVLFLAALVLLAAARVDRNIVRGERAFVARQYPEADEAFASAERALRFGQWIPSLRRRLDAVHTQRASLYYWQRQYDRILPANADPLTGISQENVDLQLIAANAAYRRSQPTAKDRPTSLKALDAASNAYLGVLRNAGSEVAAYNYEYVVRLREDIDKGRHEPDLTDTAEDGPAGQKGGPPKENPDKRDLKLLIPLEPGEMDKAIDPGKGTPIPRKG